MPKIPSFWSPISIFELAVYFCSVFLFFLRLIVGPQNPWGPHAVRAQQERSRQEDNGSALSLTNAIFTAPNLINKPLSEGAAGVHASKWRKNTHTNTDKKTKETVFVVNGDSWVLHWWIYRTVKSAKKTQPLDGRDHEHILQVITLQRVTKPFVQPAQRQVHSFALRNYDDIEERLSSKRHTLNNDTPAEKSVRGC